MDYSKLKTADIIHLNNKELSEYIYSIQDQLQMKLTSGLSIDDIIDQEDPFEGLEPILPQEVYPILVLAMINNIRSDTVMEAILEGLQKGIKQINTNPILMAPNKIGGTEALIPSFAVG